jgi:putative hydrolase of the HAD superfamily
VPELCLFDLDGTLIDGGGLPEAMRATCEAVAAAVPGIDPEALARANTAAWQRLWPELEDDYMLGGRRGDDIGRDVWRAALAAVGVQDEERLDRTIAEWGRQEHASLRLYPDALPALDALRRDDVRVGMVTNGAGTVQRNKLAAVGILDRFDPLVVSSEAGFAKPDPAIFEIALAAAGADAAETWFVGDNLWHDIPGATTSGIRTFWLDRGGAGLPEDGPRPDAVIATLAELLG